MLLEAITLKDGWKKVIKKVFPFPSFVVQKRYNAELKIVLPPNAFDDDGPTQRFERLCKAFDEPMPQLDEHNWTNLVNLAPCLAIIAEFRATKPIWKLCQWYYDNTFVVLILQTYTPETIFIIYTQLYLHKYWNFDDFTRALIKQYLAIFFLAYKKDLRSDKLIKKVNAMFKDRTAIEREAQAREEKLNTAKRSYSSISKSLALPPPAYESLEDHHPHIQKHVPVNQHEDKRPRVSDGPPAYDYSDLHI